MNRNQRDRNRQNARALGVIRGRLPPPELRQAAAVLKQGARPTVNVGGEDYYVVPFPVEEAGHDAT